VKYKRVTADGVKHPDIYQLLAYTAAADLPSGLLVYAAGEAEQAVHRVVHLGKTLEVRTLDLEGPPEEILAAIAEIAVRIRQMRRAAARDATTNSTVTETQQGF
jgi:hypothetical protein